MTSTDAYGEHVSNQLGLRLSDEEIGRLIYNWIGVDNGYLGDFSYASHNRFWLDVCDMFVDTGQFEGTTRQCFETTLSHASAVNQAAVLRAVLEEYPPPAEQDPAKPRFRRDSLHQEIRQWITRLETGALTVQPPSLKASEVVKRALDDAATLMTTSGPASAVDRVHTAMHGYLISLGDEIGIDLARNLNMNQILKKLKGKHPSLSYEGARHDDIKRINGSLATILDALNPVRNNASLAHPNELLGEPEAMLVINTVQTLLTYLEARR